MHGLKLLQNQKSNKRKSGENTDNEKTLNIF